MQVFWHAGRTIGPDGQEVSLDGQEFGDAGSPQQSAVGTVAGTDSQSSAASLYNFSVPRDGIIQMDGRNEVAEAGQPAGGLGTSFGQQGAVRPGAGSQTATAGAAPQGQQRRQPQQNAQQPRSAAPVAQPCLVDMPTGDGLKMVQTLMGGQTPQQWAGSRRQYGNNQAGPTARTGTASGPVITNGDLDHEANLMAGAMRNLGNPGDTQKYRGFNNGKGLATQAQGSPQGSAVCIQLERDVDAVNNTLAGKNEVPYNQWRASAVGPEKNAKVRRLRPDNVRVARTDFFHD